MGGNEITVSMARSIAWFEFHVLAMFTASTAPSIGPAQNVGADLPTDSLVQGRKRKLGRAL
jgi:hypothetical protein